MSSNRLRIAIVAVLVAIIYEVLGQNGIEVSAETVGMVEGILVFLGYSDGQRWLGYGQRDNELE